LTLDAASLGGGEVPNDGFTAVGAVRPLGASITGPLTLRRSTVTRCPDAVTTLKTAAWITGMQRRT
jgi:hypothetical protein